MAATGKQRQTQMTLIVGLKSRGNHPNACTEPDVDATQRGRVSFRQNRYRIGLGVLCPQVRVMEESVNATRTETMVVHTAFDVVSNGDASL